jgi:hypothetical protein
LRCDSAAAISGALESAMVSLRASCVDSINARCDCAACRIANPPITSGTVTARNASHNKCQTCRRACAALSATAI